MPPVDHLSDLPLDKRGEFLLDMSLLGEAVMRVCTPHRINKESCMSTIVHGERVGQQGRLFVGCCAVVYGPTRGTILLTRRQDNGRWCLPGGQMEPGESATEACAREVWEETGLRVRVGKLIGIYSSPDYLIVYADGNRYQIVRLCFEAEPVSGSLGLSDETMEARYVTPAEIAALDLIETHRSCIADALAAQVTTFVR